VVSKQAAGLVAERGYTNVQWYRDGIPAWVKAGNTLEKKDALPKVEVPTLSANKLKASTADFYIVDIRPAHMYNMGWVSGSNKFPMGTLSAEYEAIPKTEKIVVLDHAGKQTLVAGRFLKSKGYPEVYRLQGGLMAWTRKGYPLQK
jgi:rhodanese-related sulfurtransferase